MIEENKKALETLEKQINENVKAHLEKGEKIISLSDLYEGTILSDAKQMHGYLIDDDGYIIMEEK